MKALAEFSILSMCCDTVNLSKLFIFHVPISRFLLKICDSSVSECFLVLGPLYFILNLLKKGGFCLVIFDHLQFLIKCLGT